MNEQIQQIVLAYAQLSQTSPEEVMQQLQQLPLQEQQKALKQMQFAVQQQTSSQQMMQKGGKVIDYSVIDPSMYDQMQKLREETDPEYANAVREINRQNRQNKQTTKPQVFRENGYDAIDPSMYNQMQMLYNNYLSDNPPYPSRIPQTNMQMNYQKALKPWETDFAYGGMKKYQDGGLTADQIENGPVYGFAPTKRALRRQQRQEEKQMTMDALPSIMSSLASSSEMTATEVPLPDVKSLIESLPKSAFTPKRKQLKKPVAKAVEKIYEYNDRNLKNPFNDVSKYTVSDIAQKEGITPQQQLQTLALALSFLSPRAIPNTKIYPMPKQIPPNYKGWSTGSGFKSPNYPFYKYGGKK